MSYKRRYNPLVDENVYEKKEVKQEKKAVNINKLLNFNLKDIKIDDLMLIVLIFLLFSKEDRDNTLIIAIVFLFVCEYIDLDKLLDIF